MAAFKPKEVVKILSKLGYFPKRQTGSHLMMYHPVTKKLIPIPVHAKDVKKGLMEKIITLADSTETEFLKLK